MRRRVPYLDVQHAIGEIETLSRAIAAERDPRSRMKLGRRLCFAASSIAAAKPKPDLAQIDAALIAVRLARKSGGVTDDLNRNAALLTKLKLDAMGCAEVEVVAEQKKVITVESGCLVATGYGSLDPSLWTGNAENTLAHINEGRFFLIQIGGDGRFSAVLRLVNAPEPVLKPAEYKQLVASTDIGVVALNGGGLRFGAPERLDSALMLNPGWPMAKVQAYQLESSSTCKTVLVACAAKEKPAALDIIPELQL